ncbi:hypothetical protein SAZ_40330 [Streptomyces noursei ZPM]|nr:hypothetical protein SAZ_40330 [Streptomyces noursei ZPM]EPY92134.1 hypothetical protein K530_54890 [Streptomyces noursei CCRC 11814]
MDAVVLEIHRPERALGVFEDSAHGGLLLC